MVEKLKNFSSSLAAEQTIRVIVREIGTTAASRKQA
jgi:hypothetical protein